MGKQKRIIGTVGLKSDEAALTPTLSVKTSSDSGFADLECKTMKPQTAIAFASGVQPNMGYANAIFAGDANQNATAAEQAEFALKVTSTGNLTATRDYVIPPVAGAVHFIDNRTSGAQSIRIIGATGTGATIPTANAAVVYSDGTNWYGVKGTQIG